MNQGKYIFAGILLLVPFSRIMAAESPLTLSLVEVIRLAQARHVEVITAEARVNQALSRLEQSRASLLPQLTGGASQFRQTRNLESMGIPLPGDPMVGPFNSFDARVKITQSLFDPSALERLRLARAGKVLSQAEQTKVRQDATALVATLYVEAKRAAQRQNFTQALLHRDETHLEILERQIRDGTATPPLELEQAQTQLTSTRQQDYSAQQEAVEKRLDLTAALGIPPAQPILFSADDELHAFNIDFSSTSIENLERHYEVALAQENLNVRKADQSAAKADLLPRVAATADYGASGKTAAHASGTYTYGAQVAVPLFEGGQKQARLQETQAARLEMEARLADAHHRVETSILNAEANLRKTDFLLQAMEKQWSFARHEHELSQEQKRLGTGSDFEEIQSATREAQARDQWIDATASYQMAQIQLAHALGKMDQTVERK